MRPAESLVICEGYHDRAFLNAWLLALGCAPWKDDRYPPLDKKVTGGGQYALCSPGKRWIRIVPTHGDGRWPAVTELELESRKTRPLDRVVVVLDHDGDAGTPTARGASFAQWAAQRGASRVDGSTELLLAADGVVPTRLSLMVWSASDPPAAALPAKQTLERLVCAAIARAHPARTEHVRAWLADRPAPPPAEKLHKSHAPHMAGWFSDRGYEGFFAALWEPGAQTRDHLEAILDEIGARPLLTGLLAA